MTALADLAPTKRRAVLLAELDRALLVIQEPTPTATLVKAIAKSLGERDATYVARELAKAMPDGHPARRPTGETFTRYGKTMPRYEWMPKQYRPWQEDPKPATARAAKIAEIEAAGEDWLDEPTTPTEAYLED